MNIKVADYARALITEYNIRKLDRQTLELIIDNLGYKIIQFNKLVNDDSVEFLIESLSLENDIKQKQCFTYSSPAFKRIFICDNISDSDSTKALLHEIGHIYMGHKLDSESDTLHIENEANEFVYVVFNLLKKRRIKKYAVAATFGTVVCFIIITSSILGTIALRKGNNNALTVNQDSSLLDSAVVTATTAAPETSTATTTTKQTTTTSITTTAPASTTTTKQITQQNNDTEMYYITKSGTKYHLANCYHITGRIVTSASKEDLESMGYQPCADCIGR